MISNNYKRLFFITTLALLLIGLSTISATDNYNNTVDISTNNVDNPIITTDVNNNVNNFIQESENEYSSDEKIIKKDTNIINLNNDNMADYFDVEDSYAFALESVSDSTIQLDEEITDIDYWDFSSDVSNIKFTNNNKFEITNQVFYIESENFTFINTSFNYMDGLAYEKAITVYADNFQINSCQLNYDSDIVSGDLNAIIYLNGNNSTITNSKINANIVSTAVDWGLESTSSLYGLPKTVPIIIYGYYHNILYNEITITEKDSDGSTFPTFYGMYLNGHDINFIKNNISLTGSNGYVYTIYTRSSISRPNYNIMISENNIEGISQHNYTAGIYMDGSHYHNLTVLNNNISTVSSTEQKDSMEYQDVVYAVVITDYSYIGSTYVKGQGNVTDNNIINNTIIAEGHQVYGFEQFGGDNTIITGNNVTVTGSRAQALGVIGYNTTIANNTLTVIGDTPLGEGSPDYIPPLTTGIQTLHSSNSTIVDNTIESTQGRGIYIRDSNNTISYNNIIVHEYDKTIEIVNGTDNTIVNNILTTDTLSGSQTIYDKNENSIIGDNNDPIILISTQLESDNIVASLGDEVEFFITITSDDNHNFNGDELIIYANDEQILTGTFDDSLFFEVYTIPESWYKKDITLTAKYLGDETYEASESNINIELSIPTDITASDEITLTLNDNPSTLNATITDIMNNTVDADINIYINNTLQSTLKEYTFTPDTLGNYTITLVFDGGVLSDNYNYQSSQKEMTIIVDKGQAYIEVDSINATEDETTTLTVNVKDVNNNSILINDGIIELTDENDNILAVADVKNSIATLQLTFTTAGEKNITATFKNSTSYQTVTNTTTITVNKKITPVFILFEMDEEYELGDAAEINALIEDYNEETVSGVTVEVYCNDELIATLLSSEDGWITYEFTPDSTGNYTITLKVNDNNYISDDSSATFNVIHTLIPVSILPEQIDDIELDENITINAVISDGENTISDVNIEIYYDQQYITSVISDQTGKITYTYTPQTTGNHSITFKINDENYIANDTSITFTVNEALKEYSLNITTTEFKIGQSSTIQANIYYGNQLATNITKGKVVFKINGKTLKDANGKILYAKVVNGTASIENYTIPSSWNKENITIEAVYSGSTQCGVLRSQKTQMNISTEEAKITTQDINTTIGSTITLTATVSDNYQTINTGKVVFKINGKTLKDENGKVIYLKVTNNTVSLEYTIPSYMKAKTYNITAVFISSDYERLEDTKILSIN